MSTILPFAKMHGAGNDFVMVDAADLDAAGVTLSRAHIARLCDRRFGVGADGLIVIRPHSEADFGMTYYNRDGGEAEMCGNGARCAFAFARARGLVGETGGVCAAGAGVVHGRFEGELVEVRLTPPHGLALDVDAGIEHPFERLHVVDSGVPHLVIPVDQLESIDLSRWGPALRRAPAFAPAGVNVNWVMPQPGGEAWLIRTYERGVEAETLACGTGASASGLVLNALGLAGDSVPMLTRGGDRLTIGIERDDDRIDLTLTGPAVTAFTGEARIA